MLGVGISLVAQVEGFLEKNRDTLREELRDLVKTSSASFISQLLDTAVSACAYNAACVTL